MQKTLASMNASAEFEPLLAFLERLPAVLLPAGRASIGHGRLEDGRWWVKFGIDIRHHLAWQVVQELGHVLNYLSLDERLPTSFKPVSPPPYMNGGPQDFLSWVIEGESKDFGPADCAEWLEGRLPRPVDELAKWQSSDENAG